VNRASAIPASRATDRLLSTHRCNCDDLLDLQKRVHAAKAPLVDAIVKLAEIASSPTSAAGLVLTDCRKALSALESGDE
jgi:hypothetical protein